MGQWSRLVIVSVFLLTAVAPVLADEGQWPPDLIGQLDWPALEARGLTLKPEQIWDGEPTGLASAVVNLEGCTGAFVSAHGLLISNHHCLFTAIQEHSTPEHDFLNLGFLARHREEELPAKGLRVLVLTGFRDVTSEIRTAIDPMPDDLQRKQALEKVEKRLLAGCEQKKGVRCKLGAYFSGLRYILFESMEIKDVRLVHAPPRAVGDFGGESDNWSWPRHTGDFSLARAYVARDGSSASYSKENVPFTPARHLALSTKGVAPGDLVLILGYPGRTERYLPARAVRRNLEWFYPRRLEFFRDWIATLLEAGKEDPEVALRTASTVKSLANTKKNAEGMIAGLRRNKTAELRREEDASLLRWVEADPLRRKEFGGIIEELDRLYQKEKATREKDFLLALFPRSSVALGGALKILRWAREQQRPDEVRELGFQERDRQRVYASLERDQRNLALPAEKSGLSFFLLRALALPEGQRITAVDQTLRPALVPGADRAAIVRRFVDRLLDNSVLTDKNQRLALLGAEWKTLVSHTDPLLDFARALEADRSQWEIREKTREGALVRLRPAYSRLLIAWKGLGKIYPDANSTLRLSVATVKGYSPKDGIIALPQTGLEGLLAKQTGEWPFNSPPALLKAAKEMDFGPWRQENLGTVPIDFLSDADTTGGNSGSPVLNGKGELVGLNFDRVFENVVGDYGYSPRFSRNISVDVRFILWFLDRVERAQELLEELGISLPPAETATR